MSFIRYKFINSVVVKHVINVALVCNTIHPINTHKVDLIILYSSILK